MVTHSTVSDQRQKAVFRQLVTLLFSGRMRGCLFFPFTWTRLMSTIYELDILTPFEIWEVELDHSTIKFYTPLLLTPFRLEDDPDDPDENEYIAVRCPELAISSFGTNIEELESAIRSDIRFAWRHFVQADDSRLTSDARAIKENYLAIAEAIDG